DVSLCSLSYCTSIRLPPTSTLFPYTTLFRSEALEKTIEIANEEGLETIGAGMNFKEAYEPLIKVINNIKIGFINVCEAQFGVIRSEEHTSELQSRFDLVCRLLLLKKNFRNAK